VALQLRAEPDNSHPPILACRTGTSAQVARRPGTEYVAKLVGLNLYTGHAA
jgi:hypothetical protein